MSRDTSIERQVCLKAATDLIVATLETGKALPGGGKDSALAVVAVAGEFWKWISAAQGPSEASSLRKETSNASDGEQAAGVHEHQWVKKNDKWNYCAGCGRAQRRKPYEPSESDKEPANRGH